MKYSIFVLLLVCLATGRQAIAAVTPAPVTRFWHDTTVSLSVQVPTKTAEKKVGFFGKAKAMLLSFIVKKAAPKQAGNPKRLLNIIALSLLIVGLAVPLLSGPIGFLWLVPASLVTGIVALVVKDDGEDQATPTTGKKKRRSNVAAITAVAISGGLLAFLLILSLTWSGHR